MATSDWRTVPLGSLCEGIYDGPHATPKSTTSGPIFLGIKSLADGRLDLHKTRHLSDDDFDKWTRRVTPQQGDIVFSYETKIGEAAIIPSGLRCCLGRRMGLLRINENIANPRFILYAYLGPEFQSVIRERTVSGSTVERILLTELPDYPIRIPSLVEQQAIAYILGTLDDKIELNRRINETLESIARAVFKSWFVDFDPVRAKADGRQPIGVDAETAALFPDSFEESPAGRIPTGWPLDQLSNVIELIGGGTPKTSIGKYWGGGIPWFSVTDVPAPGDVFVTETEKTITEEGLDHSSARLLPKGTTIITARGTVGKCALVGTPMAMNQSCYGIRAKNSLCDYYTYYLVRHAVTELQQKTHGSVFETITRETFKNIQVVLLPNAVIGMFEKAVEPLLESLLSHLYQSRTLAEIRNTLHPKLTSGEIRVKDAEKFVEEHAS